MQNFDGCKIWIGEDRELSAKIQDVAFKAGWTWGRSFGGTVLKPGKIRFIKFESYGGEKRMFSGHSGESNKEGFDSCPNREIYASAMGIIHHSGQCNLEDPVWLPSPGDKVKLLRFEAIDEYETTRMQERLEIGGVYEVLESDVNFRSDDGIKCIHLVEVNQWYFLSAFTKWVAGDESIHRQSTDKELLDQLKIETAEITASRFPTLPKKGDYIILNSTDNTKVFDRANAATMKDQLTIGSSYKIMEIDAHWSLTGKDNSPSVRIKYDSGSDSCWCSLADFVPSIIIDIETAPLRKYTKITSSNQIKVGDTLRITGKPLTWNSHFSSSNPMESEISYPIEVVVKKYTETYGGAFLADGFGWCLDGLIKKDAVELVENPGSGMLPSEAYLASLAHQSRTEQSVGRTTRQDPANIKVEGVTKAAPVASRVTVSPLAMVNVPIISPIKAKTIDRVTTKSNLIQI